MITISFPNELMYRYLSSSKCRAVGQSPVEGPAPITISFPNELMYRYLSSSSKCRAVGQSPVEGPAPITISFPNELSIDIFPPPPSVGQLANLRLKARLQLRSRFQSELKYNDLSSSKLVLRPGPQVSGPTFSSEVVRA